MMSVSPICPIPLPRENRLLVVLDMDLTMIHAVSVPHNPAVPNPNCTFIVTNAELKAMGYPLADDQRNVWVRPGLRQFLKQVSAFADIIVWTLSVCELAKTMIEKFDVDRCIKGVIGRDSFYFRGFPTEAISRNTQYNTFLDPSAALAPGVLDDLALMNSHVNKPHFIKNLAAIGYNMSRTVIVDDWADLCILNPENAIIVPQFDMSRALKGDDDALLSYVFPLLQTMSPACIDVRAFLTNMNEADRVKNTLRSTSFAHRPDLVEVIYTKHSEYYGFAKRRTSVASKMQPLWEEKVAEPVERKESVIFQTRIVSRVVRSQPPSQQSDSDVVMACPVAPIPQSQALAAATAALAASNGLKPVLNHQSQPVAA
jgi:hypothetical protein